jgi:hypothetical protein
MNFIVIDKLTNQEANMERIALSEDWAKRLIYCDMEGFAIQEDGSLILCDECGQFAYCPSNRFKIINRTHWRFRCFLKNLCLSVLTICKRR